MAFSFVAVGVVVVVAVGVVVVVGIAVGAMVAVVVAVEVGVAVAVGVEVEVGVKDVSNERRRDNRLWPAVLRGGLSGREAVEMIAWTDEAIEAANALLNKEWAAGIPDDLMRRALDAAVKAQKQSGIHDVTDYMNGMADGYEKGRAEALEEAAAFVEGKGGKIPAAGGFAFLISRNNQPCMSGDPRDRLTKFDRSRFDEATAELANAIRALKEKQG